MSFFFLFQEAGEYAQNQNMLQGDDEGLGGAWSPEEISKKMDPPKNLKTPENLSGEGKSQTADHLKILLKLTGCQMTWSLARQLVPQNR